VYGRGYLEAYASFLKLPVEEIMRDYDKMRTVYARHCQESKVELTPHNTFALPKFTLTPKFLLMVCLAIGMLGFASVIGYQLRRYAAAPYLELVTPAEAKGDNAPGLIVNTDSAVISGHTIPGAVVHVNGQLAEMDPDGGFTKKLVGLAKGTTTAVVVESVGQNGRKTQVLTSVVVK